MKNKRLYWLPRVLAILYIAFLTLFALDVFDSSTGFFQIAIALFMHLIPNFVLIIALILAWRNEIFGWAFIALGIIFAIFFLKNLNIYAFIFIILPILVIGALFLWNYYSKKGRKK
jgi:hypothetical protein